MASNTCDLQWEAGKMFSEPKIKLNWTVFAFSLGFALRTSHSSNLLLFNVVYKTCSILKKCQSPRDPNRRVKKLPLYIFPILLTYSWYTFFKSIRSDRSFECSGKKVWLFHALRLKLYQVQQRKKWNIAKKMSWSSPLYVERVDVSDFLPHLHWKSRATADDEDESLLFRYDDWKLSSWESVNMRSSSQAIRTFPLLKVYTKNSQHRAFYPWNCRARITLETSIIPPLAGNSEEKLLLLQQNWEDIVKTSSHFVCFCK